MNLVLSIVIVWMVGLVCSLTIVTGNTHTVRAAVYGLGIAIGMTIMWLIADAKGFDYF